MRTHTHMRTDNENIIKSASSNGSQTLFIIQILEAPSIETAREKVLDAETLLSVAGTMRYISNHEERVDVVESTLRFYVIERLRGAMTQ